MVKQVGSLPVDTIKPENRDSPLQTLHRDLMLPCASLPMSVGQCPLPKPRGPKTRSSPEVEDEFPYKWLRTVPADHLPANAPRDKDDNPPVDAPANANTLPAATPENDDDHSLANAPKKDDDNAHDSPADIPGNDDDYLLANVPRHEEEGQTIDAS